jgi:hypothetical protein
MIHRSTISDACASIFGRLSAVHERKIIISFRVLAITLGLVQVWTFRHDIKDIDGISYLDMGDAYMRGDWSTAINGMWSPFYGWILGASMRFLQPSPAHEYSVIELVNFVIFLVAIVSFEFFLRELLQTRRMAGDLTDQRAGTGMPGTALLLLGYPLFIWSSLFWITTWLQSPDMCVAVFVYLAGGILLRMKRGAVSHFSTVAFGVILGFGYLAKAAMFPIAFAFLLAGLFMGSDWRRAGINLLLAGTAFLIVAAPLIYCLSSIKSRFTFSEAGRVNYIWHVNGNGLAWSHFPHWQEGIGAGVPIHPAKRIFESPPVYEFPPPARGTYPIWYDPSYYWQGVAPQWSARQQLANLKRQAATFLSFFFAGPQCVMIVGFLLFWLISKSGWRLLREVGGRWRILLPAIAAFGIYAIVHVEPRYIGGFGVLFWLALFSAVPWSADLISRRWMWRVTIGIAVTMVTGILVVTIRDALRGEEFPAFDATVQWHYANELMEFGLQPGEKVAVMGSALGATRWARLARVQIVAETPWTEMEKFWQSDDETKTRVVSAFATTGAKAIIAEKAPFGFAMNGWHRIGTTNDFVYRFAK